MPLSMKGTCSSNGYSGISVATCGHVVCISHIQIAKDASVCMCISGLWLAIYWDGFGFI